MARSAASGSTGVSRTSSTGSFGLDGGGGGGGADSADRSPLPYAGLSIGVGGPGPNGGGNGGGPGGGGVRSSAAFPNFGLPPLRATSFGNLDATTGAVLMPRGGDNIDGMPDLASSSTFSSSLPSHRRRDSHSQQQHHQPTIVAGQGWGIGLTNSGTYTSHRCPKHYALPLPEQDANTYDIVKEVIVRRKRSRAARRAAELVKGDAIDKAVQHAEDVAASAAKVAEGTAQKLREVREELMKVRSHRDVKMREIDGEFEDELQARLRTVEREYEKKIEAVMAEEIVVEEVRPEDLEEYRDLFVEKTKEKEKEKEEEEQEEEAVEGDKDEDGEAMDVDESGAGGAADDEDKADDDDANGDANEGGESGVPKKKKRRLTSEIKTDDLGRARTELDGLNETKSQMVWLLKQVITAEQKQKLEVRKREKELAKAKASAASGNASD